MTIFPDLSFVEAGGHGGTRSQTQMVVIHATSNTASDEAEAAYATHRPDQTSAHFYNDDDSVIQAVDTGLVAYGCYPIGNARSVQFELVGLDWDTPAGAPGDVTDATMRRVAPIVARVCAAYGIPIRKIGPSDLVTGTKGICGHGDVTKAWHQGDHLDPGPNFPWSTFIGYVQAAAAPSIQEDSMGNSVYQVPQAFAYDADGVELSGGRQHVVVLPLDNAKGQDISVACDLGAARLRVAWRRDGGNWDAALVKVDSSQGRLHILGNGAIPGGGVVSIGRCQTSRTDVDSYTPVGVVVNSH